MIHYQNRYKLHYFWLVKAINGEKINYYGWKCKNYSRPYFSDPLTFVLMFTTRQLGNRPRFIFSLAYYIVSNNQPPSDSYARTKPHLNDCCERLLTPTLGSDSICREYFLLSARVRRDSPRGNNTSLYNVMCTN